MCPSKAGSLSSASGRIIVFCRWLIDFIRYLLYDGKKLKAYYSRYRRKIL